MATSTTGRRGWVQNALARGILGLALALPYPLRVALVGWIVVTVVAPFAGWKTRILNNLDYAMPEVPVAEKRRIARGVADNFGRTLIEIYSGEAFVERAQSSIIDGPGMAALKEARAAGRPIILVTAHMGNYDAVRGKLSREGFPMGALYRPMSNLRFNAHYVKAISTIADPVFPTDARGITKLVKLLKSGGVIGIVADVASRRAPLLEFFDRPAHTPLSSAEWALKYDALLVPVFGIRQPDGLTFRIEVQDPIPHTTPEAMMQTYNDVVERFARKHPEQWFWIHKRWKLSDAAKAGISADEQPPA
jgi:KDO2-lipid IV(A) lauroyltransferase